jgi:hypothetical protein
MKTYLRLCGSEAERIQILCPVLYILALLSFTGNYWQAGYYIVLSFVYRFCSGNKDYRLNQEELCAHFVSAVILSETDSFSLAGITGART